MLRVLYIIPFLVGTVGAALHPDWSCLTNSNTIYDLEARRNEICAATSGGLLLLDSTGRTRVIDNLSGLPYIDCRALALDDSGALWIGFADGRLASMDEKENFKQYSSYRQPQWTIRKLRFHRGYILVAADQGLSIFSPGRGIAEQNFPFFGSTSGKPILDVLGTDDSLFVLLGDTLAALGLDWGNLRSRNLNDPLQWRHRSVTSSKSLLFLAGRVTSYPGIETILVNGEVLEGGIGFTRNGVLQAPAGIELLQNYSCILADRTNQVWFGTPGSGIVRLIGNQAFVLRRNGLTTSLAHKMTRTADNRVWITSGSTPVSIIGPNGLTVIDGGEFQAITPANVSALRNPEITGIVQHPAGAVLLSTWGGGISSFDPSTGNWKNFGRQNSILVSSIPSINPDFEAISDMLVDGNGRIWGTLIGQGIVGMDLDGGGRLFKSNLGLEFGLAIALDSTGFLWTGYLEPTYGTFDTLGNRVAEFTRATFSGKTYSIRVDSGNRVWFATQGGVQRFSRDNSAQGAWSNPLPSDDIRDIAFCPPTALFGNQQVVWVASYGKGIKLLNDTGGVLLTFTQENSGLLSNNVNGLLFDQTTSDLWVSSDQGVSIFRTDLFSPRTDFSAFQIQKKMGSEGTFYEFDYLPDGSNILLYTLDGMLVNRIRATSQRNVRWDLRNLNGGRVRSGLYYYLIKSPGGNRSGKIIIK